MNLENYEVKHHLKLWSNSVETFFLTLYTLTSECIFSTLFSKNLLRYWQGEFIQQLRASSVGDHFLFFSWPSCV